MVVSVPSSFQYLAWFGVAWSTRLSGECWCAVEFSVASKELRQSGYWLLAA